MKKKLCLSVIILAGALILTGAAIRGPSAETAFLLLAYALGAATSLGLALLAGGRIARALRRFLGLGELRSVLLSLTMRSQFVRWSIFH